MSPHGRPKGEYRRALHAGLSINRTCDRACARANACEWASRPATRVAQP